MKRRAKQTLYALWALWTAFLFYAGFPNGDPTTAKNIWIGLLVLPPAIVWGAIQTYRWAAPHVAPKMRAWASLPRSRPLTQRVILLAGGLITTLLTGIEAFRSWGEWISGYAEDGPSLRLLVGVGLSAALLAAAS